MGLEFAKLFAADGWDLVLSARSEVKLASIAAELARKHSIAAHSVPLDLSQPGSAQALVDACQSSGEPITALINNAGFATWGPFAEADLTSTQEMIHLNITSLTELTRLLLPDMVARNTGYVLNVSSMAAFQPGPLMSVYYASKAYVLLFSEGLAEELADSGVRVSALCPGPTETGFEHRAAMENSKLFQFGVMDAGKVALLGYRGLLHGERVVIPGLKFQLSSKLVGLAPRKLVARVAKSMQGPRTR